MLQIDQLIACLQSSVNQRGLLADKKREGRCSGDHFFFTVCVKHFSGFIEALGSKGILCTLKKVSLKKGISKFISPDVSVIYLFANLRVFLVGLGNLGEFLRFFIEVSEEI